MNNIVDQVYVINMKKDTERLNKFNNQVNNLFKYTIVRGVDAVNNSKYTNKYNEWILNNNIIDVTYDNFNWKYYIDRYTDLKNINTKQLAWNHWINYGKKELRSCNPNNDIVNRGQWGCLYSHINIIRDALKNDYESILILEDDIILTDNIHIKIEKLKQFIKGHENWGIIYLGASQHIWNNITICEDYYHPNNTTGTFAYMIHNSFYQIILDELLKFKKPIDNYLVDIQKKYKDYMYVLYPNIIICNLEDSNIGEIRNNYEYYKKFKWDKLQQKNVV
jgi:GR25 family glycosyltransferase involved in LPS biosynthesis